MRVAEVHLHATLAERDTNKLPVSGFSRRKRAEKILCVRHPRLDLADRRLSPSPPGSPHMRGENKKQLFPPTQRRICRRVLPSVSVSRNTGACLPCGNPICGPKLTAPPFPPTKQPSPSSSSSSSVGRRQSADELKRAPPPLEVSPAVAAASTLPWIAG